MYIASCFNWNLTAIGLDFSPEFALQNLMPIFLMATCHSASLLPSTVCDNSLLTLLIVIGSFSHFFINTMDYYAAFKTYFFHFSDLIFQFALLTFRDGIANRCGSFYMSLSASCFAVPLVTVRLNYKFVIKSCVFADHFNQSIFDFL